ncbi:threonine deaminase, partial [Coemansia nantahalensis]
MAPLPPVAAATSDMYADALPSSRTINENAGMANKLESETRPSSQAEAQPDYLQMILSSYVYDVAVETPLTAAVNLSTRMENNVLLKREDLQPVFSFKIRGAHNKISHLTAEEKQRGIIACSAGNHAQGVALSAKQLGIKATIVMPVLTPAIKWKNVERLGAQVVLHGAGFDEAKVECSRLAE